MLVSLKVQLQVKVIFLACGLVSTARVSLNSLQPTEVISTHLRRAYREFDLRVSPRRKLGKWNKTQLYVLKTCGQPPRVNSYS